MAETQAFGRKVRVTIYSPDNVATDSYVFESDLMNGKRGLKISGTINKYFALQPADATIDIYNLSPVESANIIALRMKKVGNQYVERPLRIRVEAGYAKGYFGTIFDGQILKPTMVRPDANNTILRLTCLNALGFVAAGSILTQTFNDGINFYSVVRQIAIENGLGSQIDITPTLQKYLVDGAFVSSTTLSETMQNIAQETGTIMSYKDDKLTLKTWNDIYSVAQPAIVLNSNTGLVGFPALNTDGITFQSVLNPNIDVFSIIKLDNSVVSINQPDYLTEREQGAWLSSDSLYGVIKVTHQFDTTNGSFSTNGVCLARDYYKYLAKE